MSGYVVIDADGQPVSFGTEVADEETLQEHGLEAVEVDRLPDEDHDWVPSERKVRALTEDERDARLPGRREARERKAAREAVRSAAKKGNATTAQKLDYIIALLED